MEKFNFELGKKSPNFKKYTYFKPFKPHLIHHIAHMTAKLRCSAIVVLAKPHRPQSTVIKIAQNCTTLHQEHPYTHVYKKFIFLFLHCVGAFYINGPKPVCYTKAYELMDKGVGTSLVGLCYRPACAQARHA